MKKAKKINLDDVVKFYGNDVRAGTLLIAEGLERDHESLIKTINRNKEDFEKFGKLECANSKKKVVSLSDLKSGKARPKIGRPVEEYWLNVRQATLLITYLRNLKKNDRVKQFKIDLVDKFFIMKDALTRIAIQRSDPDWIDARESGKPTRLQLTDIVKPLRLQAMEQNPNTTYREQEDLIYVHYTKVIYQALFIFNMPLKKVRDMLSIDQIKDVDRLESLATDLIVKLMFVKTHYKEIYQVIKEKAIAYGEVVGKSNVPLFQQKQLALF